ncbi:MAG: serine hydrolase [Candidatus Doudnabacteria bacterium]|nr:serine hydrolase [Candidatus Doudnabacteria bacterium]
MNKNLKTYGLLLIPLGIGLSLGYFSAYKIQKNKDQALFDSIRPVRLNSENFKYINPLLGYSIPSSKEFQEFKPLNDKISSYISAQTKQDNTTKISVYFRDLNKGRWIGINENEKYDPASMLKVVIMVAFYKEAENNPEILSKKIDYNKSLDEIIKDVPYQTPSTLQVGQSYSTDNLIEKMIINSDNGAKNALLANIDNSSLRDVYTDLGIDPPSDTDSNYKISAKAYSSFFRILYNATYLTPALSEKALNLLSQAEFNEGLVAGVPTGTKVSQKFGEHVNTDSSGQSTSTELHDCGIVYLPNNPYALCIMTEGQDINNLEKIIRDISSLVYKNVTSNYQN